MATGVDVDGVPLTGTEQLDLLADAVAGHDGVVTDQSPEPGTVVETRAVVMLWLGRGGGSAGVREPRRPLPTSLPSTKSVTRELRYSVPPVLDPE